jgi:cation diffusion facilitator family transporter
MDAHVHKRKSSVALLSVISNSTLVLLKLVVGILIGSVSVISEAIHSGVDLLAAIIALIAVRVSGRPADRDHPFGHGKIENISGAIEAILIFIAAAWIIYEAIRRLVSGDDPLQEVGWGVAVMFISSAANVVVSSLLFKVGKETQSMALLADAWHLKTDVWTSAGVMAGLGLIWIVELIWPGINFHWIDAVAAISVAILIIRAAYHLTVESSRDLMDVTLPDEEVSWIREHISTYKPQVRAFHELRTRKSGPYRFVEFHLLVKSDMSVDESHRITDLITDEIEKRFPHSSVTIHIEPCDGECVPECESDCLLSEKDRETMRAAERNRSKRSFPITE